MFSCNVDVLVAVLGKGLQEDRAPLQKYQYYKATQPTQLNSPYNGIQSKLTHSSPKRLPEV